VVWRTDGGGRVTSARQEHHGAERVARGLLALARRPPRGAAVAEVNGALGLLLRGADDALTVIALTVDGGRITAVDIVRNPDKLRRVPEPPPFG
jgi:RNA polymerase sigma-70 factor (ECF subfamily)